MNSSQRTFSIKASQIEKKWLLVDADGAVLGRLATEVAHLLRGKHKTTYTQHMDDGDNVIVINADKVVLTGSKGDDKEYFSHSHFPGGVKFTNIKKYKADNPEFIIEHAVKGMLPKNRLGRKMFKNLKVYAGTAHPHQAQKPETYDIKK
ncbi:MAG TPA: 50S ribosomal protein L13 [Spirochaetota bacterium]|nr:50S ribosomal protein L13 [Spirochaetota bacterium]HNT11784.1 50S ribosomal protein L13 [Spirochaetota bacterium]HNV47122.1 50S ribosomal protein L13 [Spirochaetota bacterium]HOS41633.1 50S ribosomal protein L13 [Spirochaetota bacterium]HPU88725.1 50S ribosomal protein L13 [Spirochaetota bacterium]